MKPVAVMKKSKTVHPKQRTWLNLKNGIEKSKKSYEKYLVRVLSQVWQSQNHWTLDLLKRPNIGSDGFGLIAAEAARLSHCRRRNIITRKEICSALAELYPARCQEHPVRDGPCSDLVANLS